MIKLIAEEEPGIERDASLQTDADNNMDRPCV